MMALTQDITEESKCMISASQEEHANDVAISIQNQELPSIGLSEKQKLSDLLYSVDEPPPWYMCLALGFQHYLMMVGSTVAIPLLLSRALCIGEDNVAKSELIGTIFFVSGIVTLLQTTFGVRLPIVQGGSFSFLVPTFAILSLPQFKDCPNIITAPAANESITALSSLATVTMDNNTIPTVILGSPEHREAWQLRMREIQGAIMVGALFQVLIGFSGVIGVLLRYTGPLSITPTITLIGLSLFSSAANFCQGQWWIATLTMLLLTVFSQYLKNVTIPSCRGGDGYPVFKLFPVILSMLIVWGICAILTATNVLPRVLPNVLPNSTSWGYKARTDFRIYVLNDAAWIRFPYPGQWGLPTVSVAGVFGILAGVLASIVESIGDYYACARLAGAVPPPTHAVNRGIGMEGIGCIIAGAFGSGNGTTSYSQNIGAIGITKVGSRRVIQVGGLLILVLSIIGKFGALFVTIPDPVIGGVLMVLFGMITSVGLSNLQFIDLNSSRNLFILGFSLFFGFALPQWVTNSANSGAINTNVPILDQLLTVLCSTSMFVGGLVGFVLDNTIPGTVEERGIVQWRSQLSGMTVEEEAEQIKALKVYDLPFGMSSIRKIDCLRYIPFCPTFTGFCGRGGKTEKSSATSVTSENTCSQNTRL